MALEGFGGVFVWQIAHWHEVAVCQNCVEEDGPVELIGMLVIDILVPLSRYGRDRCQVPLSTSNAMSPVHL